MSIIHCRSCGSTLRVKTELYMGLRQKRQLAQTCSQSSGGSVEQIAERFLRNRADMRRGGLVNGN